MRRNVNRLSFVLPTVALLGLSGLSSAQEWTRFRGPNGSGIGQANLPDKITDQSFRWKVTLPGSGHSSPVIWGDRVFVTCTPAGTTKRVVVGLDTKTGSTLWQKDFETPQYRLHADNNYSAASPALDAERVFVLWCSPQGSGLAALDQKDGREVWRKELGPFVSQHGPGTSPIVFEDTVIVYFDHDEPKSFVAGFDVKTGAERWRYDRAGDKASSSTPCIFQPKNGAPEVILISNTAGMTAVNARTGQKTWELPQLISKRCVASPVVSPAGLVFAQCGEGRAESFVYAVRPGSAKAAPEKVYEVVRTGGYVPTPLVVDDLLYLWKENGLVTCLRAASNESVWSERVEGPFYGSPICVGDRIYNLSVKGDLVVLAAGEKFQQIARVPLGEGSHATPAVSGGRLFLRTFSHLICVGN
jgi:outer membrane protein assembly factor BamB